MVDIGGRIKIAGDSFNHKRQRYRYMGSRIPAE